MWGNLWNAITPKVVPLKHNRWARRGRHFCPFLLGICSWFGHINGERVWAKKKSLVVPSGSLVARVSGHVLPMLVFVHIKHRFIWFRQHARPRTQTEHSSHWAQCFCLCQRCDTCPNLWKRALFFKFLGHTWNMSKSVMMFVFKVLRNRLFRHILETCPNLWWRSCSKCYAIDCFGTYLKRVQTCDDVRVQSATQSTASVHTSNMSKPVMTFVFKVLRNRLLRYILQTCPNLQWRSCSKCYAIDCFGAYLKHVQTCDDVRVRSATKSTASVHKKKKKKKKKKKGAWGRPNVQNLGPLSRMFCNPVKRCVFCA